MPLGQRAHQLRMVCDKTRADELAFDVFTNKSIQESGGGVRGVALNLVLLAKVDEESVSFRGGEVL